MQFKVKDLMITVLTSESNNLGADTAACPGCTLNLSPDPCKGCTNCTASFYTKGRSCFCKISDPRDLAILKEELKGALLDIENKERVIAEAMRPKSISEVEELEEKLNAALGEIRTQKMQLQKTNPVKKKKSRSGRNKK